MLWIWMAQNEEAFLTRCRVQSVIWKMTSSIASRDALIPLIVVNTQVMEGFASSAMLRACRNLAAAVNPGRLTVSD